MNVDLHASAINYVGGMPWRPIIKILKLASVHASISWSKHFVCHVEREESSISTLPVKIVRFEPRAGSSIENALEHSKDIRFMA